MAPAAIDGLIARLALVPGFSGAELAGPPEPLTGGFFATMSTLRLTSGRVLVLRVMPDPEFAWKETVFQREVARQGYPTPVVHLAGGPEDDLGGAYMVMDLAPGGSPLAGLDTAPALLQLPRIARSVPRALGEATAQLHALDPEPVREGMRDAPPGAWHDPAAMVGGLAARADEIDRTDLARACRTLLAAPPRERVAVTHGDIHPFNLLVDGRRWTLIDWSTGLLADPAWDVAFTLLILRHPPLPAPGALRPVVAGAGRTLARAYLRAYRRAGGTLPDRSTLAWYTKVHALRVLVERAGWAAGSRPEHPFNVLAPAAARIAGVAV